MSSSQVPRVELFGRPAERRRHRPFFSPCRSTAQHSMERQQFITRARRHGMTHVYVRLAQFTICGGLTGAVLMVRGLLYISYIKYAAPPSAPPAPSMAPPALPDPFTNGWQDEWWWSRQVDIVLWDRLAILLLLCMCVWRPWQEILPVRWRGVELCRFDPRATH